MTADYDHRDPAELGLPLTDAAAVRCGWAAVARTSALLEERIGQATTFSNLCDELGVSGEGIQESHPHILPLIMGLARGTAPTPEHHPAACAQLGHAYGFLHGLLALHHAQGHPGKPAPGADAPAARATMTDRQVAEALLAAERAAIQASTALRHTGVTPEPVVLERAAAAGVAAFRDATGIREPA